MNYAKALGAIAATASTTGTNSMTVTITTSAPGLLGWLGFTRKTAITLPVAAVVAAAEIVGYGVCKGIKLAEEEEN